MECGKDPAPWKERKNKDRVTEDVNSYRLSTQTFGKESKPRPGWGFCFFQPGKDAEN